jgi:LysM repeat protein
MVVVVIALTGCELRRSDGAAAAPAPVSDLPTLVPLGSEGAEPVGEATAVPTVINVEPTAVVSNVEVEINTDPAEPVVATAAPASIPAEPAAESSDIVTEPETAVEPETFTPPAEEPAESASIVVDATTNDLPEGGPIAADPPFSQTTGDYVEPAVTGGTYIVQPGDTLFSIGLRHGTSVQALAYANGLTSDLIYIGQELLIAPDGGGYYPASGPAPYGAAPAPYNAAPVPYNAGAPTGGPGIYHVVAPGETLFAISSNYNTSVDAIAGANGIPYPYIIQVGQQLIVPAYGPYPGPPAPAGGYYQPDGFYQPGPGYGPPGLPPGPANGGYYQPDGSFQPNGFYQPDGSYQSDQGYGPPGMPPGPAEGGFADNGYPGPGNAPTHTVAPGETLFSISQIYGVPAQAIAASNGLGDPNQIYVGQVLYLP